MFTITATRPSHSQLFRALKIVSEALDEGVTYWHRGRFHFAPSGDRSIALSADDAGRLRIDSCHRTLPGSRVYWCLADDEARLASLVVSLAEDVALHD